MPEQPKPPSGLRAPGKRLWDEIVSQFIPSPGELEILRQAVRCVDEADRLEQELRKLPFTVPGFNGQPRVHPGYKVLQEHRLLIRRLIDSLNIPDAEEEVGMTARQRHAQRAAQARWAGREVS
jgi:hypothetical protein